MWMTTCLTSLSEPRRVPSAAARASAGGSNEDASTPPAPAAAELNRRRRVTSGMKKPPFGLDVETRFVTRARIATRGVTRWDRLPDPRFGPGPLVLLRCDDRVTGVYSDNRYR